MFSSYVIWHYVPALRRVVEIAGNFIAFALHLFSIKEMFESLFAPWRRITEDTKQGGFLSPTMLWAVWDNILSRVLGAIARSLMIALGGIFLTLVTFVAVLFVVVWIVGPVLPVAFFFLGIVMLF